jgi:hypothetical protein
MIDAGDRLDDLWVDADGVARRELLAHERNDAGSWQSALNTDISDP